MCSCGQRHAASLASPWPEVHPQGCCCCTLQDPLTNRWTIPNLGVHRLPSQRQPAAAAAVADPRPGSQAPGGRHTLTPRRPSLCPLLMQFVKEVQAAVPDKNTPIVITCWGGGNSRVASNLLVAAGYKV